MNSIGPQFLQLASAAPLSLVWVVGIVLTFVRLRGSHTFWLVLIALLLFLVAELGGSLGSALLITALQQDGFSATRLGVLLGLVSLVRLLLSVAGWVLILVALFWRPRVLLESTPVAPMDPSHP